MAPAADDDQDGSAAATAIDQVRTLVGSEISACMTDSDCIRFLRARPDSPMRAAEMAQKWFVWRSTLMSPSPPCQLAYSPNIVLANPHPPENNPHINLVKAAHFGFDRDGRPIYWEKTGTMQSTFDELYKHFTIDDLVQLHVYSQEMFELRIKESSLRRGTEVTNEIVVFDMTNLTMVLNMQSIAYMKDVLAIDQNYYPERLYKLFIINSPWYFSAIYNIFKPFIDKRTRDKFNILGSDYLSVLLDHMDITQIPSDYGGDAKDVPWCFRGTDEAGCSAQVIKKHVCETFAPDKVRELLTEEEIECLNAALKVSDDITSGLLGPWDPLPSPSLLPRLSESAIGAQEVEPLDENTILAEEAMLYHTSLSERQDVNGDGQSRQSFNLDSRSNAALSLLPGHPLHLHAPMLHVRARMVKAESTSSHHLYLLVVEYGDSGSWPIRRRYSDFVKFRDRLKDLANDMLWPKLPPKTIFKKSMSVVSVRLIGLDFFLSTVIDRVSRLQVEDFGPAIAEPLATVASGQRRRSAANYWRESLRGMNSAQQGKLRQELRLALLDFLEVSKHFTVHSEHRPSMSALTSEDPRATSISARGSIGNAAGVRLSDASAQVRRGMQAPAEAQADAAPRRTRNGYISAFTFSVLALLVGIFIGNFYTIMSVFGKSFFEDGEDEMEVEEMD